MIEFGFRVYCPHCEMSDQYEMFEFDLADTFNRVCLSEYKELTCCECDKIFWSRISLSFELDEWDTTKKRPTGK